LDLTIALIVFVASAVGVVYLGLNKAGVLLDKETGQVILASERPAEVTEEELRGMSAFTDTIGSLDLEGF
jgi:hypothetical protein